MSKKERKTWVPLPENGLPILVLEKKVLLPGGVLRVDCKPGSSNFRVAEDVVWKSDRKTAVLGAIPGFPSAGQQGVAELNAIGTVAKAVKVVRVRNRSQISYTLLLEGLARIKIQSINQESPYINAKVDQVEDVRSNRKLEKSAVDEFRAASRRLIEMLRTRVPLVAKFQPLLDSTPAEKLCDLFAGAIDATFEERLAILNEVDVAKRFDVGLKLVNRQLLVLGAAGTLVDKHAAGRPTVKLRGGDSDGAASRGGRRPAATADEDEDEEDTLARLARRIDEADLSEPARKAARRELRKIKGMERNQSLGPEHQKAVAYIEWLTDIPWTTKRLPSPSPGTELTAAVAAQPDLKAARAALDRDHYGLDKVKRRIVEYVAVHHLNPKGTGTILCLVGPPGVGKTSLGKSIASCLGREFLRISLGGIRDESDIRGFSRTYVGSQPGRLIQGMKEVKGNDPVVLLDEIDKIALGSSVSGDPSSAMLEVLDPAQNSTFVDRYITVPYDLSKVLFIATANSIDTIPAPLLDRMEVIQLPGYTLNEKLAIASRYIVPRQITEHGLSEKDIAIPADTLAAIGEQYTMEAGVRNLERKVASVCRYAAVKMVESGQLGSDGPASAASAASARQDQMVIKEDKLVEILGAPIFEVGDDPKSRVVSAGIAIGLAANAMGGSVLFVEATKMSGTGNVKLTGSLGDVIKESAHIALGWIRSHAQELGVMASLDDGANFMDGIDLHIHFPEGAVGKDGPSAGVTLVTALTSVLTGRMCRSDTAMTGEVTLTGTVLPVGGVTSKVLAAYRRGIRRIILPHLNFVRNLRDIPEDVQNDIEFVPVHNVAEVLEHALAAPVGFPSGLAKL
mmetsp:Transcript_11486/g.29394  ORF Transcript_11486/g.29394 Transcript_11486/m.29394 type:complete len:850 (+) Transcript_11486:180-2729(+)